MISNQQSTIKEQESIIASQKSLIGKMAMDTKGDSDYDTNATYSDTDDNLSPSRRAVRYMRRMNSCSTISNFHMAEDLAEDTITDSAEVED